MTTLFFRELEPPSGWDAGRAAVTASQRGRMLHAVTRAVAQKGYGNVTVADIVASAGVSRRTFYEQFENKEDCFLAAYEAGTQEIITDIRLAGEGVVTGDWRDTVRAAIAVYTKALAEEPEFARVFLVDVFGAGPKAVARRFMVHDMFVEQWRSLAMLASYQEPDIGLVPDVTLTGLVGAISELVQRYVLRKGPATLTELTPVLSTLAIRVIESERK